MSVSVQNSFNVLDGDGSNDVFTYTFATPLGSTGTDVLVYVIDDEDNITLLASNYTLDLSAKTVTYPVTAGESPLEAGIDKLPAGWQIAIYRVEDIVQDLDLTTQGPFPAAAIMAQLDYLTFVCQQQQEQINRCVKYPIGQAPTSTDVNDFIAAVNAIIATPPIEGTYLYCKTIAALAPTTPRMAIVSDAGEVGEFVLYFYSGLTTVGDAGWFQVGG